MDIVSPQNARVKEWAQLLEKKHRTRQHKYIIEGIHLVQEALRAGADLECVVYDGEQGVPYELAGFENPLQKVEWISVTPAIIAKCTDTMTPQPVFAIVRKSKEPMQNLLSETRNLVVVLDNVQDPGNVGTIIRSADAAGAAGVVLGTGCADVYNPKTIRSTMGSLFHLPIVEGSLETLLPEAKAAGVKLVSTSLQAEYSCYSYDFTQAVWLVIGNEGKGISESTAQLVDDAITIPMQGQAESLNAAMAATVLLFETMRQRLV
ncbi:rRNA methyltransferase [Paenibacillus sp. Root52]|uniref:TrmH family RNA methyltransferase n=1 Tax=Paenibacillus sp. Root52 TaxID=1736552 RepID=UPI0006F38644|nr:RNA methyltransferase [Paenibacillus sp. Root52]KQY84476.1 rRNA methyltransferase [Paenibacillus sp. Root52]